MVLKLDAKHGIQSNYGSRDMGPIVTPKRLFPLFLEKYNTDFKDFLSGKGFYGAKALCKTWDPVELRFSRYGANSDPEKALSTVS